MPDAAPSDGGPLPCPPDLVDEGDACVGWRAIPPPPCLPIVLARVEGDVVVRCDTGGRYRLSPSSTWEHQDAIGSEIVESDDGPTGDAVAHPLFVVDLANGSRVAAHGDPYAFPAAWRTDATGAWRDTLPPPSAFVTHAAAISDDEALFVGQNAFVFTFVRR